MAADQTFVFRRLLLFAAVLLSTSLPASAADESADAFLQGLRQRGYHDTALEFLDRLEQSGTSESLSAAVDYERALIWLDRAEADRRQDDRKRSLQQAETLLQNFLRNSPQHPQAASARSRLGRMWLDQARQLSWQAAGDAEQVQRSHSLLQRAHEAFQRARQESEAQLQQTPFVAKEEDVAAWTRRRRTEARFLNAWLHVGSCLFEQALLDTSRSDRSRLLREAEQEFSDIVRFSRTSAAGVHARLMMGRCWQELGDISKALGFFNELKDQRSPEAYLQQLSHTAEYHRLQCLAHPSREDFAVVVTEATRWLEDHRDQATSESALGIRLEKAKAAVALLSRQQGADQKSSDEDRQLQIRRILQDLELVTTVLNPVQTEARSLAAGLRQELGDAPEQPQDFATAFDQARQLTGKLAAHRATAAKGKDEQTQRQYEERLVLLQDEAARLFRLALDLRTEKSDVTAVAQAEYLLSYLLLQQHRPWDAFVLARHVMQKRRQVAAETAEDAAEMAISAAVRIWSTAESGNRDFELSLVRDTCEEVIQRFPGSSRATDARLKLGRVYLDLKQPRQAAETFLKIPPGTAAYAGSRIQAGQALWLAWAREETARRDEHAADVDADTLATWKNEARELLEQGIQLSRTGDGATELTDEVVRATVSLCGILNHDGNFDATVSHLSDGEPSVLDRVGGEAARPPTGIRSVSFAGLCYRTMLRACVGTRRIDQALQIMQQLEGLGASGVASVYTQLGRELQQELEELKASGDQQRLQDVRESLERFLSRVYETRDPSNTGALLWIAETSAGLALGQDDAEQTRLWQDRASAAYRELLQAGLDDTMKSAVTLRLVQTLRDQKKFTDALQVARDALTENPVNVTLQIQAAHVLADQGTATDPSQLLAAMQGIPAGEPDRAVWGWALLARRLRQSRSQASWPELRPLFVEARYELSRCRVEYARAQPDASQQLTAAARELISTARMRDILQEQDWLRFETLYQQVCQLQGRPVQSLRQPGDVAADVAASATGKGQPAEQTPIAAVPTVATDTPPPAAVGVRSGLGWLLAGTGIVVLLATGGMALWFNGSPRNQRRHYRQHPESIQLPGQITNTEKSSNAVGDSPSPPGQPTSRSEPQQPRRTRRRSGAPTAKPDDARKRRPRPRPPQDKS